MIYDLAILGGGPAGVAAGVYAARKRLSTVLITRDFNGQSAVSDGIENWIGTPKLSGADLSKNLENHLRTYAGDIVTIALGESIESVTKTVIDGANAFTIKTDKREYSAKTLLITTGSARRKLDVPGADVFEHKGVTYCASCDGPLFADQDVVVIGAGNAGFESASQLLAYCKSVTLLNRSSEFSKADPVTVKKVLAHPRMKAIVNAVPTEVKGTTFVESLTYQDTATGETHTLPTTGIFVEIGSVPNTWFAKTIVTLDQWNHIVTDPRTQRAMNAPGIWAAGDCTDGLYHQNNIAAGDAVKALEDIYLFLNAKAQ
jgi:NADH-dependent peroxiredoxin subunit F